MVWHPNTLSFARLPLCRIDVRSPEREVFIDTTLVRDHLSFLSEDMVRKQQKDIQEYGELDNPAEQIGSL